jgi:hypothetical protein
MRCLGVILLLLPSAGLVSNVARLGGNLTGVATLVMAGTYETRATGATRGQGGVRLLISDARIRFARCTEA